MPHHRAYSWVLTAAAAVLALVGQGWLAPVARASCGDYVTIVRPDGTVVPPMANHGPVSTSSTPTTGVSPQTPPRLPCGRCPLSDAPGRRTCQGPFCSENHTPAPAPSTTVKNVQESWACLWSLLNLADANPARLASSVDAGRRVHHVSSIFHPPRAA